MRVLLVQHLHILCDLDAIDCGVVVKNNVARGRTEDSVILVSPHTLRKICIPIEDDRKIRGLFVNGWIG